MKTEQEQLEYINTTCNTNYKSMDDVDWFDISVNSELTEEFIREYQNEVDWYYISINQKLSKDFIREFSDKVDWEEISVHQQLSESFIRENKDKVKWGCISMFQKLSESFIREFQDKVNWEHISIFQKLSEPFIREFTDKVEWYFISKYQKISENFIREFQDNMVWLCISKYQTLSESFIKEFQERLGDVKEKSWLYKDKEFLKQQVVESGLYECHDDYFIAYKGIRSNRYSALNFHYQYLTGKTYESNCDCTDKENSFGLSVWTEEKARDYCNQLVVKVKINYEDVGRVIHNGGKIRCRKITILD